MRNERLYMTPTVTIIVAILGFFSALALLASALLFLYVARELRRILDWLREFTKMYLGIPIPEREESKGSSDTMVKMQVPWNEDMDGKS